MAVKVVRVSDLSDAQADESQFGKLIVHQHPDFAQTITLDVLPNEIGELPESEIYVEIEFVQPGDRSGQRATLTVDQFNKLGGSKDMKAILTRAVEELRQIGAPEAPTARRGRRSGAAPARSKINYASLEHAGEPHRGRITDAEKELVRNNLDKVNKRLRDSGLREINPNDPTMKDRYGL
ncbi:MAG TPA: hypothetical protein VII16_14115 [Actinomycetes bacterium]|jgi:hypothetical protein